MHILVQEWATGSRGSLLSHQPQPCPFCGHPTGDCVGEEYLMATKQKYETEEFEFDGGAKGRRLVGNVPGTSPNLVVAKERIYEEVPVMGSERKTRRLVAHEGAVMPRSEAERLGIEGKTRAFEPSDLDANRTNTAPERYVAGVGEGKNLMEVPGMPFDESTRAAAGGQTRPSSVSAEAARSAGPPQQKKSKQKDD